MVYLVKTTEQYRAESEQEAKNFIEEQKKNKNYTVDKYSSEYKCTKAKGEVVDEWYRVSIVKSFTSEKEPDCNVSISYSNGNAFEED